MLFLCCIRIVFPSLDFFCHMFGLLVLLELGLFVRILVCLSAYIKFEIFEKLYCFFFMFPCGFGTCAASMLCACILDFE